MRVTQVVRRPPSEPTNGRPCSLLHHLGLVSLVPLVPLVPDVGPGGGVGVSAFSPPPPLASLSALSLPSRSEHVKVIADTTVRERTPPIYPMALATVAAIADGDTPCVATRLDNSSVHGPRLPPPLPAWRPRRRQATPPQYGWVHSRSRCSLMDIACSSPAPHRRPVERRAVFQKQAHCVRLRLHIRQRVHASNHLDHAARVFAVLDAYQVRPCPRRDPRVSS